MPNAEYYKERSDDNLDRRGELYEHFLFGDITAGKNRERYLEAVKKYTERSGVSPRNIPFQDALHIIHEVQREDPYHPQRRFMKDLYNILSQKLNMASQRDATLGVYSAVGSLLDHLHGVDATVEFQPLKKADKTKLVTLNSSLRAQEKEEYGENKADVLIPRLDPDENPREYKEALDNIATQITERLLKEK